VAAVFLNNTIYVVGGQLGTDNATGPKADAAQIKAALSVNRELIELYWSIGRDIVERQQAAGWGKSVVEQLALDLQSEFPGISTVSARNIWHARAFYLAYADPEKLKQSVSVFSDDTILKQVFHKRAINRFLPCWHKFRGVTTLFSCKRSNTARHASGMPSKPSPTAGQDRCLCIGSNLTFTRGRARHCTTSRRHCPRHNQTWRRS